MSKGFVSTSQISEREATELLEKIARGESVAAEERLDIIQKILAFSSRDWSTDPELWLLYSVAFNDGSEKE